MSTQQSFKIVNPALTSMFDLRALLRQRTPGANLYTGLDVKPGDILAANLFNRNLAHAHVVAARALANQSVGDDLIRTPADVVYVPMARLALEAEADSYIDPQLNRPGIGFNEMIGISDWFQLVLENHGDKEWMTHQFQRGMLGHWLTRQGMSLHEATDLWLGGESVGWLNFQERQATFEAIRGAMSQETHDSFLSIWQGIEGEAEGFENIWAYYVKAMGSVRARLAKIPCERDVRRGHEGYAELFRRLQVGHTAEDILEWAQRQYALVEAEMNRLSNRLGHSSWQRMWRNHDVGVVPDGDALVALYKGKAEAVLGLLEGCGLIPPAAKGFGWDIKVTSPESRSSFPTLVCFLAPYEGDVRRALFMVTPYEGDTNLARQHAMSMRLSIAHELGGHAYGSGGAFFQVPAEYALNFQTSTLGLEGVAFSMEAALLRCLSDPTIEEALAMLQGRLWRYARVIFEIMYHTTETPADALIAAYARQSGISKKMATRDARRAMMALGEFSFYAFGAAGVQRLGEIHPDGFLAALGRYQKEACGYVPPHLYAAATGLVLNGREFNWLVTTDVGVETTKMLWPK